MILPQGYGVVLKDVSLQVLFILIYIVFEKRKQYSAVTEHSVLYT